MSSTIKKNLLLFFHLNIFYSSIKESKRPQVIKNCYWPILNIAEKNNIKIGIEISGHTLEVIKELDNYWIIKLRFLIKKNLIFIIGSGYSQIIGPLVPYKVNIYNYKIGNQIYKKILNQKLKTLLINEQTFSKSLIDIIKKNSYNSIIIDRDNLNLINNFQRFKTTNIKGFSYKLKVIWNSFLHNQKFQKYIYDKLNLDQYLFFLKEQIIKKNQFALLYGGDAEIFNFRPKITDHNKVSNLHKKHEWKKIENLLILLNKNYNFLSLAEILKNKYSDKKVLIDLTDAKFPCITKKQPKYNITRWALSGVNDFKINTYCYKIYDFLIKKKINKINDWKKLCYFWTSDFRTHITKERWKKFNASLTKYVNRIRLYDSSNNKFKINFLKKNQYKIEKKKNILNIECGDYNFGLNLNHGMSLEYYFNSSISNKELIKTLYQGYYRNPDFNVDFYSGHFVSEFLNKKNITDISERIENPFIRKSDDSLEISNSYNNIKTSIKKKWIFNFDNKKLSLDYSFKNIYSSCENLRHSIFTLNPNIFEKNSLFFATHNGGQKIEKFNFRKYNEINHLKRLSNLVSATTCQGMTEGVFEFGDKNKKLIFEIENKENALIPFVQYFAFKNSYFCRLVFSSKESDDTTLIKENSKINTRVVISSKAN